MPPSDAQTPVDSRPISGIDHALIGVADLDKARDTFNRLGFTTTPRGRHIGWGTGNYTVMFENDYIELLGVVDPSQYIHGLDAFLESGEGLLNVALATADAEASFRWLQQNGIETAAPEHLQRLLETEGGDSTLQFRNLHLPPEITPGLKTFACEHLTRDMVWRPEWLSHPNGATGISAVTVVMESLDGLKASYARLFGDDAVSGDERKGHVNVDTGNDELWFVTPKTFPQRHYDRKLDPRMTLPGLAALTLTVTDPQVAALYLSGQQVAYEREYDGTITLASDEACGVLLEFAAAS